MSAEQQDIKEVLTSDHVQKGDKRKKIDNEEEGKWGRF